MVVTSSSQCRRYDHVIDDIHDIVNAVVTRQRNVVVIEVDKNTTTMIMYVRGITVSQLIPIHPINQLASLARLTHLSSNVDMSSRRQSSRTSSRRLTVGPVWLKSPPTPPTVISISYRPEAYQRRPLITVLSPTVCIWALIQIKFKLVNIHFMLINSPDCSTCLFRSRYGLLVMVGGVGCVGGDFSQTLVGRNS